ncbi:MAG TPA: type II toxin-antitoxin system PemK/MazF family toxin [Gaiellaceae bacterium]
MRRGDVHALALPARSTGREQRGRRYAVVIQTDFLDKLATVVVAPTSTSALPTVFRPEVEVAGRRTRVLTEQLRALDRSRLGRRVGTLAQSEVRAVDDALKVVLGLF